MSFAPAGVHSPQSFIAKWQGSELSERSASQEHFIDLCRLLGQPTPAERDPKGIDYAFEKSIAVTGPASAGTKGDRGFVDVWWRGKFAWEFKRQGKHRSLDDAYRQLCQYREALENPPLLVVGDIDRIQIHTNFTGTAKQVHEILLPEIGEPRNVDLLRRLFEDPASFKPTITTEKVTEEVARRFAELAEKLRAHGHDPQKAAHFLMRCMFCLFAEDVGLLPRELFKRTLLQWHDQPARLTPILDELFRAMANGGSFGADPVLWFNGGLFDDAPAIALARDEIGVLLLAAAQDWSAVEPAIFGTLFERSLDPQKRSQIGAHYTSRDDIMLVIEPVILVPLRREWEAVKGAVADEIARRRKTTTKVTKAKADQAIVDALMGFDHRLASVRVLDPACGSGNFLYVAIQQLLDLEKEVITFAAQPEIASNFLPQVRPSQLHGIEINPYAAELAQVVIWIGYLQWMRDNGFKAPSEPILEPLKNIECRDAILDLSDPKKPKPAEWPEAEFVVGNPPFLGCRQFRESGLSSSYVSAMHAAIPGMRTSDLCGYWFELARRVVTTRRGVRAGLLATQAIRGVDNREVLRRISDACGLAFAWSDRGWVLDGAAVRVAIIGFPSDPTSPCALDGAEVSHINPDLTADGDASSAQPLSENKGLAFMGDTKGGSFELDFAEARLVLASPNPNGRPTSHVVRPWRNGSDVTHRARGLYIIDFGPDA